MTNPDILFLTAINSYRFCVISCLLTQIDGPQLIKHGFSDAIAKVGMTKFLSDLFWVGMFYHLYNQVFLFRLLG